MRARSIYNSFLLSREATRHLEQAIAATNEQAHSGDLYFLMERAGQAVTSVCLSRFPTARRIAILIGRGNNGGDGLVAARLLQAAGIEVELFGDLPTTKLARRALSLCDTSPQPLSELDLGKFDLFIDAIFGIGFRGQLPSEIKRALVRVCASKKPLLAIDILSGLDCDSGIFDGSLNESFVGEQKEAQKEAQEKTQKETQEDSAQEPSNRGLVAATLSVTFFAAKLGHKLLPGKALSGDLVVHPLGIDSSVIGSFQDNKPFKETFNKTLLNRPVLWAHHFRPPALDSHKYRRGHVSVFVGQMSGAARLCLSGALSVSPGMVSYFGKHLALDSTLAACPHLGAENPRLLPSYVAKKRVKSIVFGSGGGKAIRPWLSTLSGLSGNNLSGKVRQIWDADALSDAKVSPAIIPAGAVISPHAGEAAKLGINNRPSRLESARQYSLKHKQVLLLKGNDSLIAHRGKVLINDNASSRLARAGSGDFLAGMVGGLMARQLAPEDAAAAAVWLHAEASHKAGDFQELATEVNRLVRNLEDGWEK